MKKLIKQSLSLALALLMVLSLIPAMPLVAKAEDFTPGETWTVESAYAGKLEGAFTPAGDDFIYEAGETLNWKAWLRSAVAVDKGINVKGTLTYNGQKLEKTVQGLSVAKGGTIELCSAGSFPEITDAMYGNFTLTVQIYHGTKLAATGVLNFVRNAPAETEPVETEPVETEPVETEPEVVTPANLAGFRVNDDNTITWLEATGVKLSKTEVNATAHMYGISKGGYATCSVSEAFLMDFNGKVIIEVEYATTYGTNFTLAYTDTTGARKDAVIAETKEGTKSNTTIAVYNIEDAGFNGTLVSGGEAFGILADDTTGIKAVTITKVVEETPEQPKPVEYKAKWTYKTGYEFINGSFNTAEEDFIFAGTPYDWTVTINSDKSTGARIDATLETQDGQVLTASKEVTIPVGEFQLFDYTAFPALTNELIGNFKLTTTITVKLNGVETPVAQLEAVFGRSAAYVEPQPEEPGKVEYKAEWTYKSGYEFINGAFNTAEEDFIFAGTPYDWTVTVNSEQSAGARIDATLETQDGQVLTASKELTIPVGEFQLFDYTAFPQLTNELIGNFKLTTTITVKLNGVETPVAQLVAVFGRSAAYVEPEAPAVPTKPGEVVWQYANSAENESYSWMNGAVKTENDTGIYKGWDNYDWAITLSPTKTAATITVEAEVIDHTGATVGTVTKDVEVGKAPAVTTILTAADLGLSNKTLGDFRVSAVIKYTNPETQTVTSMAQVQFVFGRRIGDAGYTATSYLPSYEWINAAFNAIDEDKSYVGEQPYDWNVSIAPTKMAGTADITATVIDEQGNVVASLNKTGVDFAKTATTTMLSASELAEQLAGKYGKFAVTTVISIGGKDYVGVYGVFEHVEGEWVAPNDPTNPVFTPADWEACGLPQAIEVHNPGEMAKKISVNITITKPDGTTVTLPKTVDVAVGGSAVLANTNQLRTVITERGKEYTVTIAGYWKNAYQQVDINEELTYVWAEHTDTEDVPGYAATCTKTGLTDGVYCNDCEGYPVEQEKIEIDPEAHADADSNYVCDHCGADMMPTDSKLKFTKPNTSGGDLKLGDDIRASFVVSSKNLSYDRIYLEFVMKGEATIADKLSTSTGTTLRYDYIIRAPEMTEDVTITIYGVKDGVTYRGEVITYSVRKCVEAKMANWINNAAAANQCKLLMNMLYYGEQAQLQFGINTDKLATAGLPQEYLDLINKEVPSMGTLPTIAASGKVTKISHGLQLQEKVKLSTVITVSAAFADQSKVSIEVKHHRAKEGDVVTYTYTSENIEFVNSKNIRFYFDKVAPSRMRDELEIVVYYDGAPVSATYTRSMDMVCNQSNYINNMPNLIYAIMNYADAAKVVFG